MNDLLAELDEVVRACATAEKWNCTGDQMRCLDGNGCECAMNGRDRPNAEGMAVKYIATHHAEIAQAVRDAAMLEWSIDHARWLVHEHEAYVAVPVNRDADLSSKGMRRKAIDDAMRGGVE